ncbi:uncharacterized protein BJ171DRAFT_581203 [Polychytrium aggregatum]|uniref:uncharacterized protein n=1 Tax=Polychytrium aggregatum TaxID=110093 RepID=UPI0022FECBFB|nr:uncharacterized protein BJ171DRAFT_581203 [Polychytrium aggregatum]KAI9204990.1 hypothetical protein BJ171DRAFT_581203 [Polychytrium aggregatum]
MSSVLYLDDYLDTSESLATELSRRFTELHENFARSVAPTGHLRNDFNALLSCLQTGTSDQCAESAKQIAERLEALLELTNENVRIAIDIDEVTNAHGGRMADDCLKFKNDSAFRRPIGPSKYSESRIIFRSASLKRRVEATLKVQRAVDIKKDIATPPLVDSSKVTSQYNGNRNAAAPAPKPAQSVKPHGPVKGKDAKVAERPQVNESERPPAGEAVEDENRYCICGEVSYGRMIGVSIVHLIPSEIQAVVTIVSQLADTEQHQGFAHCPIEWFHIGCIPDVDFENAMPEKWFCPQCQEAMDKKKKK